MCIVSVLTVAVWFCFVSDNLLIGEKNKAQTQNFFDSQTSLDMFVVDYNYKSLCYRSLHNGNFVDNFLFTKQPSQIPWPAVKPQQVKWSRADVSL